MRLYGINMPFIESHQLRQAQTADIARNLYYDHMDIFHTRLSFIGDGTKPTVMEFPLMHGITALCYCVFGVHEIIGRLVSLLFSVGALLIMYGLARQFLPIIPSLAAMALYGVSPMNIFFSRAFMPESSMMFFMVAAVYFFFKWLKKKGACNYLLGIVCAIFACLAKPTAGVLFAPILAVWFLKERWGILRWSSFWAYFICAAIPILGWAFWANYISGTNSDLPPEWNWLNLMISRGIWQPWFTFQFYEFVSGSIILLLLTPIGFVGMIMGMFCITDKTQRSILFWWIGAIIAYFFILSGPNSGHVYYQLHLLPPAAILFGFSIQKLSEYRSNIKQLFRRNLFLMFFAVVVCGYVYGYYCFFSYMYEVRMPYDLEVAQLIKKNTTKGDIVLLNELEISTGPVIGYYSQRPTWMFNERKNHIKKLEDFKSKGATIFAAVKSKYGDGVNDVKTNLEFWKYLNTHYHLIAQTDNYLIYDLRHIKAH